MDVIILNRDLLDLYKKLQSILLNDQLHLVMSLNGPQAELA